jgi:hypothetical protein
MMRDMRYALLLVPCFFLGCSTSEVGDAGPGDAGSLDAGGQDAGPGDAGVDAGTDGGGGGFTLLINNYLSWCDITEDGAAFSPTKTFSPGTVVNLHAAPLSGFVWGYWSGTDADTGSHDTNMAATATMNANKTVLACCPFPPPASQTCP